jgi:hypothetical protein
MAIDNPTPTDDTAPQCACGCQRPVSRNRHHPERWNTYIRAHNQRGKSRPDARKVGEANRFYIHGGKRAYPVEYYTWCAIHQRCGNPNNRVYSFYGGRGIQVCERWADFRNFIADMGPRPAEKNSIDRIDPNGHYEPGNCRWATPKEQGEHRRVNKRTRMIEYGGQTMHINAWAKAFGIKNSALRYRLKQGWPLERAFGPIRRRR